MAELKPGDVAPDFTLRDQRGKNVSLADYRGRKLLIYFYPKADTPGCTKQAVCIRDERLAFTNKKLSVLGISPDLPERQKRFDEKFQLDFPLLSDPDYSVAKAYGVWKEKSLIGMNFLGIIRSSFLIDERGKIVEAWYKVKPKNTAPYALETVDHY